MSESYATQNQSTEGQESAGKFWETFFSWVFFVLILLAVLWNWDGFWQTNIGWLNNGQQAAFPVKYAEEQMKISRAVENNKIYEQLVERLASIETENQRLYDEKQQVQRNLDQYLDLENEKCRYYDTALRMMDHLARKYSDDERKRVLSCTSVECENILTNRALAESVCS